MANIPISALPNVQPSGYTPNDLLVLVNYDLPSGTTKNTSLLDISNYVLSGVTFTGNTSASCISDLYVTNVYGCSPITIHDSVQSIGSQATGVTSFAFGENVSAFGDYSHAEGRNTISLGGSSHAEGIATQSIGGNSHAEGNTTQSIGDYSHAEGFSAHSIGFYSHAEGNATISFGEYSHSEGYYTQSTGFSSHAEGRYTVSSGYYSHAEGSSTTSSGQSSHSEGSGTTSVGNYSHAEGYGTQAIGEYSHAEGFSSFNKGATLQSIGNYSHAEGSDTKSRGLYSHSEGLGSESVGNGSHSEGVVTESVGIGSHSEGYASVSTGTHSHSEGYGTESLGENSHAEGRDTTSTGFNSHSEGQNTDSIGYASHAEGSGTQSIGSYSHSEGLNTIASGAYQHVSGRFNESGDTTSAAFIIGNGINNSSRSNLLFAAGNQVNISGKTITTNFQMTSGATDSYVLTSDSLGNGSWEEITTITGLTFNNGTYDLTVNTNTGDFTQSLYILAGDMTVTGGTYNPSNGEATFTTNSGGTFNVSGFLTGYTDTNIYTVDGSLTGNRVVDLNGYTLTFNDDIIIESVYFGKGSGSGSNIRIGDSLTFSVNTIGDSNIAMGYGALALNDSGNGNVSIGRENLYQNQIGNYNVSIGNESLYSNFQGTSNTSVGHQSLYSNNNGFNNTSVGYQAGYDVQTGGNNTFIGNGTGGGIVGGNFNTIIGANVTGLAMSLSNNIIIADGQGNQRINVDNTGNVGIGTTTPTELLDISGKTKTTNLQMTSGATNNYIMTSDAGGNGSWSQRQGYKYTIPVGNLLSFNPITGSTYYIGPPITGSATVTTSGTTIRKFVIFTNGVINSFSMNFLFNISAGVQQHTFRIYNRTQNTSTIMSSTAVLSGTTSSVYFNSFSLSVNAGDYCEIGWTIASGWTPKPTGATLTGLVVVSVS